MSWNVGMVLAFPSIVVPSVLGNSKHLNPDEIFHMTASEASWLGIRAWEIKIDFFLVKELCHLFQASVSFIVQPIGNLCSGFIVDLIGRKWGMILVNFVPAIAWILLPSGTSQTMVFVGFALNGIGIGLYGSITYISEIWWEICFKFDSDHQITSFPSSSIDSEPSVRGVLMGLSGCTTTTGIFLVWMLGSFFSWRVVAFTSAAIPILSILMAFFVPETPIWLLSKNRNDEAKQSLQILRGWVSTESISTEFKQLQQISQLSSACADCLKSNIKCQHPAPTLIDKFKDMTRKRSLKPFFLVTMACAFMQFTAMFAMRPYIIPILSAFGILLDANLTTTIIGAIGLLANVILTMFVRFLGKRRIYLWSNIGTFLTCFGLCKFVSVFTNNHSVVKEISIHFDIFCRHLRLDISPKWMAINRYGIKQWYWNSKWFVGNDS